MTLPPHQSRNPLANQFASFFNQKIKRIHDMFTASAKNSYTTHVYTSQPISSQGGLREQGTKIHQKFLTKLQNLSICL